MNKQIIATNTAPKAVGTYSQAVKINNTVYLSGQIGLDPNTQMLVDGFAAQTQQVFQNLAAVCQAAGGSLANIVKLNIYLTDLTNFATLNDIMAQYFSEPYPARAAIEVAALPKQAVVEMDAIMVTAN